MKEEKVDISNEEDLKQKVVLPYIKSLGFTLNELEFEKNFSIRLGRQAYKIRDTSHFLRKLIFLLLN